MRNIRSVLQHGVKVDARSEQEYRAFQNYWTRVRVDASVRVSELFEKADKMQADFDDRYQRASEHFQFMLSKSTLELHTVSNENSHQHFHLMNQIARIHPFTPDLGSTEVRQSYG